MTILSSAGTALYGGLLVAATKNAPSITWVPSAQTQGWASKLAFALMIAWLIWIGMQYVLPSKRGRAQVGWGRFFISGAFCVLLLDLRTVPTIINLALDFFWYFFAMLGFV